MIKRRGIVKQKKSHPWKKFNYFGSKPKEQVDLLGYIAEAKFYKTKQRLINKVMELKSSAISTKIQSY